MTEAANDFGWTAKLLRSGDERIVKATLSNNLNVILAALDRAAAERAVLVSDDGGRDKAVWIPISQCEVERRPNGIAVVTMPEWWATEKGLV